MDKGRPVGKVTTTISVLGLMLLFLVFHVSATKADALSISAKVLFSSDAILGTFDFHPWSPNRNVFAGLTYAGEESTNMPNGKLVLVDVAGLKTGGAKLIELPSPLFPKKWISSGQWANNSLGLYLHPADSRDIVFFDVGSQYFSIVKRLDKDVLFFRFSPTEERILYVSSSDTGNELRILSNRSEDELVASDVHPFSPRWLSARRFVYSKGSSLYLVEVKRDTLRTLGEFPSIRDVKAIFPVSESEFLVWTAVRENSVDRGIGCLLGRDTSFPLKKNSFLRVSVEALTVRSQFSVCTSVRWATFLDGSIFFSAIRSTKNGEVESALFQLNLEDSAMSWIPVRQGFVDALMIHPQYLVARKDLKSLIAWEMPSQ